MGHIRPIQALYIYIYIYGSHIYVFTVHSVIILHYIICIYIFRHVASCHLTSWRDSTSKYKICLTLSRQEQAPGAKQAEHPEKSSQLASKLLKQL